MKADYSREMGEASAIFTDSVVRLMHYQMYAGEGALQTAPGFE